MKFSGKLSVYIMQIMFTQKVSQRAQVSSEFVILIIKLGEGLHGIYRKNQKNLPLWYIDELLLLNCMICTFL